MVSAFKYITAKLQIPKQWDRKKIRETLNSVPGIRCDTIKLPSRPGSGKEKGTAWEREFAKILSLWWSYGDDPHVFAHRSSSGGARRDKMGESGHSGDVFADKVDGLDFTDRYSMELKFYADLSACVWALFTRGSTKILDEFWTQAVTAAEPYNRFVLLVLRANARKPLVVTDDMRLTELMLGIERKVQSTFVGVFPLDDLLEQDPEALMGQIGIGTSNLLQKKRFRR